MWGQLAAAGVSLGAQILGGIRAGKAAGAAANIQAGQAQENADLARALPYRLNPYRQQSAEQWSKNVRDVYDEAGNLVMDTAGQAGTNIRGAAAQANQYLDPYATAGTDATRTLYQMATDPEQQFKFSENDPSYQWRLEQGQKALERSAAARGTLFSGGTGKALTRYAQGAASQEYQAEFDRFMKGRQFAGDTLSGLATRGYNASGQMGENLTEAERIAGDWATQGARTAGDFRGRGAGYQSDMMYGANESNLADIYRGEYAGMGYMTDKATAQAGGQVGQANAFSQTLGGAANTIGGALTLGDMTNWGRPQSGGGGPSYPNLPSSRPAQNVRMSKWYLPQPGQQYDWGND